MEQDAAVSPERILEELAAIGFARAGDVLQFEGEEITLKSQVPQTVSAAISGIERTGGGVKVKFYDKMRALELLGKSMGLFDGKSAPERKDSNLLDVLLRETQEALDTDDLPELQQTPESNHDLVEPNGIEKF